MLRRALIVVSVGAALALSGCSSDPVDTSDCTVVAPVEAGRTEVTITAKSMAFDVECVQVEPGTLVVTLVNDDKGVPHNLNLKGHDKTELTTGPDTQTLTVELAEPGTYDFVCDPHPQMKGAIVVA